MYLRNTSTVSCPSSGQFVCIKVVQGVTPCTPHRAAMPNTFLSFFIFFLLVCFRRLSTLLPPMCVILVVYCQSCVCQFATSCVPSLTPSSCTVAALPYDFTDEVILTDEVFIIRFVAARLSPFKVYHAPIVRTPGDVTSPQESKPAWLSANLAVILQPVFVYYYCLCLKSYTFIFLFYYGQICLFLSCGSSVIGLPFPPLGCFSVVFVYVTCAVSWLHRRGSILLPTMWSEILCSLSSSIAVAD